MVGIAPYLVHRGTLGAPSTFLVLAPRDLSNLTPIFLCKCPPNFFLDDIFRKKDPLKFFNSGFTVPPQPLSPRKTLLPFLTQVFLGTFPKKKLPFSPAIAQNLKLVQLPNLKFSTNFPTEVFSSIFSFM